MLTLRYLLLFLFFYQNTKSVQKRFDCCIILNHFLIICPWISHIVFYYSSLISCHLPQTASNNVFNNCSFPILQCGLKCMGQNIMHVTLCLLEHMHCVVVIVNVCTMDIQFRHQFNLLTELYTPIIYAFTLTHSAYVMIDATWCILLRRVCPYATHISTHLS